MIADDSDVNDSSPDMYGTIFREVAPFADD